MGASVRVEATALTDPRFAVFAKKLARRAKWKLPREVCQDLGRGIVERVWSYCTDRGTDQIDRDLVDEIVGVDDASVSLVAADLAEEIDRDTLRMKGGERLYWLQKKRDAAAKGAEKRWKGGGSGNGGGNATGMPQASDSDATAMPVAPDPHHPKSCPTAPAPAPSPALSMAPDPSGPENPPVGPPTGGTAPEGGQVSFFDPETEPPDPPPPKARRAKRGRKAPKVPLPDDWRPTRQHAELARELRVDLQHETAKFRDHALAYDRRAVRWGAAFSNWLRQAHEYQRDRRPGSAPGTRRDGYVPVGEGGDGVIDCTPEHLRGKL